MDPTMARWSSAIMILLCSFSFFNRVDLGPDIMHDAKPAHALEQLLAFELVQGARAMILTRTPRSAARTSRSMITMS